MIRVVFLPLLAAICLAAQPSEEVVKKDLKLFQGKWKATAAQDISGKPLADENLKKTKLTVDGNKFVLTTPTMEIKGTFTIDPTKKPKTIDVFGPDGKGNLLVRGIYEIVGDKRRSCFVWPEKGRPDKLRKEEGYLFLEWQRDK